MSNGIGRVWAVNAEGGDEGRPNGVGPVWIENADQLGSKLPEPESGDAGKVLGVLNSDGDIGWVVDQGGMAQVQSDWDQTDSSQVSYIANKPNLATVATTGAYSDLSNKPTIPSGVQLVPAATSSDADKVLTVDSLGVPGWAVIPAQPTGLFEAVYGTTTFADIAQAVTDKRIVYCKVDQGYGQARMAFLAYKSNVAAEFQYYRSISSHSASTQTDEVYIYKVNADGWTTTTRKAGVNVTAGTHMSQSYSNDTLTLNCTWPTVDQTYDSASANAQSGVAVAQAIAAIPAAPTYTAGDGIAISAQNAISAKVGGGVTIGNASSTASVTDNLSVTPIKEVNVRLYPIFGRLNADTANALANGSVTIKTLVSWNDAYNHPNYRPGIFIYNSSWGYNKYIAMMFGTNSISGSIPANTEIVYDINDVNTSLSNLTIETILANPTNYVFFALPCDSSGNIDWDATYGSVTSSTAAAVISTATYQSTVTVPNSIILENPLPASAVGDANKVLTVNAQGAAAWSTPATVTVDQTYNASSTNAQSGTAVAGALATVRQVPTLSGAVQGQVLSVDGNGGSEWGYAILDVPVSMMGPSDDLANDIVQCLTYGTKQVFLSDPYTGYKLPLVSADFNGQGYTLHDRVFKGSATLGSTVYTIEVYWLPDEEGEGADGWKWTSSSVTITNIQQVNALPANPDANTLYLIPEA